MPPPRSTRVVLLPVAALLLLLASSASAQRPATLGRLTGSVTGEDGKPLPHANITLLPTRMGTAADETGVFTLDGIPAGTYAVTIEQISAETKTIPDVVIKGGELTKLGAITLKAKALELKKVR
jgi:iron complex outermembrane receptor protein